MTPHRVVPRVHKGARAGRNALTQVFASKLSMSPFRCRRGRIPPIGAATLLGEQVGRSKAPFVMQGLT